MARPFSTRDAQEVISGHSLILNRFAETMSNESNLVFQVNVSVERLIAAEVRKCLSDIPVEELNRDKQGIRIKLLKDAGYETVAELVGVDVRDIEAIDGIGEGSSRSIIGRVSEFVNEAKKGVRVKLSVDNKTTETTGLVNALYIFRSCRDCIRIIKKLDSTYGRNIREALRLLASYSGKIRWLFASGANKERTTEAYDYLLGLLYGEYGDDSRQVISIYERILTSDIDAWKDFEENSIQYINLLEELIPGVLGADDMLYGLPEDIAHEVEQQTYSLEGLNCTLRKYQEWGVKYVLRQKRVLLGDEMGLGKTIQAIAVMVALRNTGETHFMVICPASVVSNWCREIARHSNLAVIKVHGEGRAEALKSWICNGGVAVTTYETTEHISFDAERSFGMLIVDEAHYIKNQETKRSTNVRRICTYAHRILLMTGTALENRVDEMISLIRIVRPDIAETIEGMAFIATAPQFREAIAPVYYRRRREDVLTELPELIEKIQWCTLSEIEEMAYVQALYSKNYADIRRVSWNVYDINESSKARRLLEIVRAAREDNRKVIVFSFFLDTIDKVCTLLRDVCLEPINGSVSPERRQKIIDEFDKAPAGSVLAAQIQSGGTGLNIQSASVVVLCEPQLKPSIENQAISRAYRMGQSRNVLVHRLIGDDTIDEKIMDMLAEKQAVFDVFADESVAGMESLEIDEKTLGVIVKEEIDKHLKPQ